VQFDQRSARSAIPWTKLSRIQQFRIFNDIPGSFPQEGGESGTNPLPIAAEEYCNEVALIKKYLLAVSPDTYSPNTSQEALSLIPSDRLQAAIDHLLQTGLLAKGTPAGYVRRNPALDYAVREPFLAIIDGIAHWDVFSKNGLDVEHSDLAQQLQLLTMGKAKFSDAGEGIKVTVHSNNDIDRRSTKVEEVLEQFASHDDPSFIWNHVHAHYSHRLNSLRAACRFIYNSIAGTSGISYDRLVGSVYPILAPEETKQILLLLVSAGLISSLQVHHRVFYFTEF
jgi:hypothetical protein